jgi:hypothetical protein
MEITHANLNKIPWYIRLHLLYGSDTIPPKSDVDPKEAYEKFCKKYEKFCQKYEELKGENNAL